MTHRSAVAMRAVVALAGLAALCPVCQTIAAGREFSFIGRVAPAITETSTSNGQAAACPAAIDLPNVSPFAAAANTIGLADGVSGGCGGAGAPDQTFRYTPPVTGLYTLDTLGSAFDTVLSVRPAADCLAETVCNDNAGSGTLQSQVTVALTADQAVLIVIDGAAPGAAGSVRLNINGACPAMTTLNGSLPITIMGSTSTATNALAGWCSSGGVAAPDRTFEFIAPVAGTFAIDTVGSSFDTVLYARRDSCGGTPLACNDDLSAVSKQSFVTVALSSAERVAITVDGFNTAATGTFTLHVSGPITPPPSPTPTSTGTRTSTPSPTQSRTATRTPTRTPTGPTPTQARRCVGDCNGLDGVTIDEVQRCVNIFLAASSSECPSCDRDHLDGVTIDEVQAAVNAFLGNPQTCPKVNP